METKYYVASDRAFEQRWNNVSWAKDTLDEAVEHARKILEKNPEKESCIIVKTIKVVRRMQVPVIIEDTVDAADATQTEETE